MQTNPVATETKAKKAPAAGSMDQQIGMRVRAARVEAKMSQEKLGEVLGLTFQQVQKYEKGANRISGPRLIQIGKAVGKPVAYFLQGIGEQVPDAAQDVLWEVLTIPGGREFVEAFLKMDLHQRQAIGVIASAMTGDKWKGRV